MNARNHSNGLRVRLRAEGSNHVRSHDFAEDRTQRGGRSACRVIDAFALQALARAVRHPRKAMNALDVRGESSDSRPVDDPTIRKTFFSLA